MPAFVSSGSLPPPTMVQCNGVLLTRVFKGQQMLVWSAYAALLALCNCFMRHEMNPMQAKQLQEKHGLNRLTPPKEKSELVKFLLQFT